MKNIVTVFTFFLATTSFAQWENFKENIETISSIDDMIYDPKLQQIANNLIDSVPIYEKEILTLSKKDSLDDHFLGTLVFYVSKSPSEESFRKKVFKNIFNTKNPEDYPVTYYAVLRFYDAIKRSTLEKLSTINELNVSSFANYKLKELEKDKK